ncbi:hypothetical protein GPALN_001834 [Globodera pallida]|nr:hypothetical protein GPALN_001834 [Globodera pallida]
MSLSKCRCRNVVVEVSVVEVSIVEIGQSSILHQRQRKQQAIIPIRPSANEMLRSADGSPTDQSTDMPLSLPLTIQEERLNHQAPAATIFHPIFCDVINLEGGRCN